MSNGTFNNLVAKQAVNVARPSKEARLAALETQIGLVEKEFGKGAIMRMNEFADEYPHIPSGIHSLDIALGIGGFPKGRIVELYGGESSGKSSLCMNLIAEAQSLDGICAYVDVEHALDPKYASELGVNMDELLVSQPSNAEETLTIVENLIKSNGLDIVVVDSVAAMVPRAELEGDMGQQFMAGQARLLSQAMRKLTALTAKSNTILLFVNQTRITNMSGYGNPVGTTGGSALKFAASVRLEVKKKETLKKADEIIGSRVLVKVVKNKMAPPFKEAEYDFIFGVGFMKIASLLEDAVEKGIAKKSGTWYSFGDVKLGQGEEKASKFLEENPAIMQELKSKLFECIADMRDKKRKAIEERKAKILAATGQIKTIEITAKEIEQVEEANED